MASQSIHKSFQGREEESLRELKRECPALERERERERERESYEVPKMFLIVYKSSK